MAKPLHADAEATPEATPEAAADPAACAQRYDEQGYFIVEKLLSRGDCEQLKAEATALLEADHKSVLVGVSGMSERYRRLSEDPRVLRLLKPLMPGGITFMSDKFVYKNGKQRFATPWHTDKLYWKNRRPKLSVWIPLDDVSAANGTLQVLPGSHRESFEVIESAGEDSNGEFRARIDPDAIPADEVVTCEIPAGSVVVFSDALLHASTPNDSGQDRYAIISTYHETRAADPEPFGPVSRVLSGASA